ncbi:MAG: hypothetical protein GC152_00010 [Alphaproteobacteria bacterium]|nr:hypothetical protein [Alphaproteobacteria bacterium]
MLRSIYAGASAIALLTAAACAQEQENEYAAEPQETEAPAQYGDEPAESAPDAPAPDADAAEIGLDSAREGFEETVMEDAAVNDADDDIVTLADVRTIDDARAYAEDQFDAADANGDDSLDGAEFRSLASLGADDAIETESLAEADPAVNAGAETTSDAQFALISKGDGAISRDDLVEARSADFDLADANGDDQLDEAELRRFTALVSPPRS